MLNPFLIFLGCGIGGLLRYLSTTYMHWLLGRHFPYGTLTVNVIGSFLMGFCVFMIQSRFSFIELPLRSFLLVGILGGYTTFSSFSMDVLSLIEAGNYGMAFLYIFSTIILSLAAISLGFILGRQL